MKINFLPFYHESHFTNNNGDFPHVLPFNLYFDEELKLLRQEASSSLKLLLEKAYLNGSLVDGSVSNESGSHYLNPLMDYIFSNTNLKKDSKILEIGFGKGVFLNKFKELGFINLTGIEPGDHCSLNHLSDINLISDFFPSKSFTDKVDLVFHSLVLEHIEDPVSFLNYQKLQLSEKGKIIFFVPNEEPFLDSGDCSSFIHEHFNFFTKESIFSLFKKTGLYIQDISIIEGLFAVTVGQNINLNFHKTDFFQFDFDVYLKKLDNNVKILSNFIGRFSNKEIAIYVPGRALNFLCLLKHSNFRLVDDSKEVQGKFLPFFKNKIESFESILDSPPDVIIIFSRTFGDRIKKKCAEFRLKKTLIFCLNDILNGKS